MFQRLLCLGFFAFLCLATTSLPADDTKENKAVKPESREKIKSWQARHERFLERARKGDISVLFVGDSITQGWEGNGKKVWAARFDPLKAANFGISGDRTEHVLWRITKGEELEGIHPKAIVMMIGTNNMRDYKAPEIAAGVTAIVKELRTRLPEAKILLLAIFPRDEKPGTAFREKIDQVNKTIAKLDDGGKTVLFVDIGAKFLGSDGTLSKDIMPDFLHLSEKGYEIWGDAIDEPLKKLLKQ